MTIPIQTPTIQPPLAPPAPTVLDIVAPILQQITQQKLAKAQLENYRALAEERKAKTAQLARDLQDQADAASAFYQHLSGAAVRLKPEKPSKDGMPSHQGVDQTSGTLIPLPQFERGLQPGALVHYHSLVQDYNKTVLQRQEEVASQAQVEHTDLLNDQARTQAIAAAKKAADEVATQRILQAADLTTDQGQLKAVRQVLQQVGAEAAGRIATTLNTGTGFDKLVAPDGTLYVGHNGKWRRDINIGAKTKALEDASRRNAGLAVDLLDEQSKVIRDLGIGASKNPTPAAIAEASRVLGISTEGLSNWLRNDPEQLTRMLRTRFSHLYIGLLPHSRSSQQLLENLAESYWAPAGSGPQLLARAERDRRHLRALLADLRDGKVTDWSRLPGWTDAANAAAAEGIPQTGQPGTTVVPNPDDWAQGVPPQ
jgi:hypothetical protein